MVNEEELEAGAREFEAVGTALQEGGPALDENAGFWERMNWPKRIFKGLHRIIMGGPQEVPFTAEEMSGTAGGLEER